MKELGRLYAATIGADGFTQSIRRWSAVGVPVVDFYSPLSSCTWANCTADGGHRSRFVNRIKAQLLLNTFCTPAMLA